MVGAVLFAFEKRLDGAAAVVVDGPELAAVVVPAVAVVEAGTAAEDLLLKFPNDGVENNGVDPGAEDLLLAFPNKEDVAVDVLAPAKRPPAEPAADVAALVVAGVELG